MNAIKLNASSSLVGVGCVLLATLGLSFKAILIKQIYLLTPEMDAISMLTLRLLLAAPFFVLIWWLCQRQQPRAMVAARDVGWVVLLGMAGFYVSALLDFASLRYIPANLERILLFLYPGFVVLISCYLRPHEVKRHTVMALLICFVGLLLVLGDVLPSVGRAQYWGVALVLGAALVFACYTVASVRLIHQFGPMLFTCYCALIACVACLIHAAALHGLQFLQQSASVYGYVALMALFSTVLPLILMAEGVRRIGASSSSIIACSGPPITILVAYWLFGEQMSLIQMLGGGLVMLGVFWVAKK